MKFGEIRKLIKAGAVMLGITGKDGLTRYQTVIIDQTPLAYELLGKYERYEVTGLRPTETQHRGKCHMTMEVSLRET